MNTPQSPLDNSVYPIPQGNFSESTPVVAPESVVVPHSVEMIQNDYNRIAAEAHDDATRFARSISGESTPIFDQLAQERGMLIPPEIQELNDIDLLIERTRNEAVAELANEINGMIRAVSNVMGSIGVGGNVEETIRRNLKREEAGIAGRLIGTVPDTEEWCFYPSEGGWFIERSMVGSKNAPYSVVHYKQDRINPTKMMKSESRQGHQELRYEVVEEQELKALVDLAGRYYKEVVTLPQKLRASKSARHRLSR